MACIVVPTPRNKEGELLERRKTAVLLAVVFIVVSVISTWFFWSNGYEEPPIEGGNEPYRADGKLRVLIIGEDNGVNGNGRQATGRSDTLMVASYDPETGELSLLSIPRDTLVEIPGRKNKDKINHAFAFGGVELTMRTVSQFLRIPLRYYIHVQTDGFRRLVDAIGGVPIYVERDMRYTDQAGGLYINLKQGEHVLNGEQAEGYIRYRVDSDLKRVERQQKFVAAALKQALKPANILKFNQLLKIAMQSVKTNIPVGVALRYLSILESVKNSNVTSYTIEGNPNVWINGINYFEPDHQKLEQLIETYFYSDVDKGANHQITVSIVVANGDRASGEQVAEMLRKHGFQVLGLEVAERDDLLVSQVVGNNREDALSVAQVLVLHEILVEPQLESAADVVVTVGKDILP